MPHDEYELRERRAVINAQARRGEISPQERDEKLRMLAREESETDEPEVEVRTPMQVIADFLRSLVVGKSGPTMSQVHQSSLLDDDEDDEDEEATYKMRVPVSKSDGEQGLVFGYALTSESPDRPGEFHVDLQGDWARPEEIEKAVYDFVLESRDGGVMHKSGGDATLVESVVFTQEKQAAMGIPEGVIPDGAWWLGYKVHSDEHREMVKRGELAAFSIEGMSVRAKSDPPSRRNR